MSLTQIGTLESKTMGEFDIFRGYDERLVEELYVRSQDPGIRAVLGDKDINRFHPDLFPKWVAKKGDDRMPYTAQRAGRVAGLFWLGGEDFPYTKYPDSPRQPEYTAAWRTAYQTPEGGTYEGQGIGKRLALAGLWDFADLSRYGWPNHRPPLRATGVWVETDSDNQEGQGLYSHLGNLDRYEEPVGFVAVGTHTPEAKEGKPLPKERTGMVLETPTLEQILRVSASIAGLRLARQ